MTRGNNPLSVTIIIDIIIISANQHDHQKRSRPYTLCRDHQEGILTIAEELFSWWREPVCVRVAGLRRGHGRGGFLEFAFM